VLLITIWELGEAAGPLLIAPLSERFGRQPIYLACHALFLCGTVTAALSKSMAVFVAARAFTGLTVASNVLNPAIIGDMFPSEQRGSAMSIVMMATLVGGNLGPALGGFISQTFCWRAVLWIGTSLTVVCELMFLVCFRETYTVPAPQIPREQVKLPLRSISFEKEAVDLDTSPSLLTTVLRPARLLYGSGVLACLALFGSIVFAFFYIISVTLPNILAGVYELSPTAVGTAFLANG
jgi:MFS family permease